MDESEPTFSTEPSSSAMRARAFTCVLTRSCQFTIVFAAAGIVFPLRAMFTAGIMRETSPARCPAPCGSAQLSVGRMINQERSTAKPRAHGDFFVILDSPESTAYLSLLLEGAGVNCKAGSFVHSLHGCMDTGVRRSFREMEEGRSHVVLLLTSGREVVHRGENFFQQFPRRGSCFMYASYCSHSQSCIKGRR